MNDACPTISLMINELSRVCSDSRIVEDLKIRSAGTRTDKFEVDMRRTVLMAECMRRWMAATCPAEYFYIARSVSPIVSYATLEEAYRYMQHWRHMRPEMAHSLKLFDGFIDWSARGFSLIAVEHFANFVEQITKNEPHRIQEWVRLVTEMCNTN